MLIQAVRVATQYAPPLYFPPVGAQTPRAPPSRRNVVVLFRGGSMISGALGKISRLCPHPLSDGPSDDGFQLTLSVSKFTYLINE